MAKYQNLGVRIFLGAVLFLGGTFLFLNFRACDSEHQKLVVSWEGLLISNNFRDAGASFNECLGKKTMTENILLRSNRWYSGFSCSSVGSPTQIYSLNYDPQSRNEYFCVDDHGQKIIGQHFNEKIVLKDLEFYENWKNPEFSREVCGYFSQMTQAIAGKQKVLAHCEAGQDRTGTVMALWQGLVAEYEQLPLEDWLKAVECDYRKSPGIKSEKYGRQEQFLRAVIQDKTSIFDFLQQGCQIPPPLLIRAREALRVHNSDESGAKKP